MIKLRILGWEGHSGLSDGPKIITRVLLSTNSSQRRRCKERGILVETLKNAMLPPLKREEGAQAKESALASGKDKEMGSFLEPPEKDTALLTP